VTYSALNEIEPFKKKYDELSSALNIKSEHFENLGEVRLRSGSISPFSTDEILGMDNRALSEYIENFTPDGSRDGPNINGLATTLGKAVEENPEKFANRLPFLKTLTTYTPTTS
jgi:hypothetical protein